MGYTKSRNGYLVQVYYRTEDGRQARLSKRVKKYSEVAEARRGLEEKVASHSRCDITFDRLVDEYVGWLYKNRRLTTAKNAEKKLRVLGQSQSRVAFDFGQGWRPEKGRA